MSFRDLSYEISSLYYDGVESFEKQLRLIVLGESRPNRLRAWQVGQALMHLGIPGWNGLTMLYLAGWYGETTGIACYYALSIAAEKKKYDAFGDWITALPVLMIPNDISTLAGTENRWLDDQYHPNGSSRTCQKLEYPLTPSDIAPHPPAGEDFTSLEQARNNWLSRDRSSTLNAKVTLISTSETSNENRSEEAISFLYEVLKSPLKLQDLLRMRMSNWQ